MICSSSAGWIVSGANKPNTAEHRNSNTQLVQNNLNFRSQSTRPLLKRRAAELNSPSDSLLPILSTMRLTNLVIGLLATVVSTVSATALTYKLEANEKACFHSYVDQTNSKVAFYFAVCTVATCFCYWNNYILIQGDLVFDRCNPTVPSMSIIP